jgi:hypothetical protein
VRQQVHFNLSTPRFKQNNPARDSWAEQRAGLNRAAKLSFSS